MTPLFSVTVLGEVPSKKNRYRVSGGSMYLDQDVTDWQTAAGWQIKEQLMHGWKPFRNIEVPLRVEVEFYIKRDKDLDNMLNSVFDLLQSCQVIENDRQIGKVVASKFIRPKEEARFELRAYRTI